MTTLSTIAFIVLFFAAVAAALWSFDADAQRHIERTRGERFDA